MQNFALTRECGITADTLDADREIVQEILVDGQIIEDRKCGMVFIDADRIDKHIVNAVRVLLNQRNRTPDTCRNDTRHNIPAVHGCRFADVE